MLTIDMHDQIYNWSCAVGSYWLVCCFMGKLYVLISYLLYCWPLPCACHSVNYVAIVYIILKLDIEIQEICDLVTHKIIKN